jgi:YqaJ-like viral recombinase domain
MPGAIIIRCRQDSDEWRDHHIGIPTASNFHRILTPKTLKLSAMRKPYLYRLIAERLMNEYLPEKAQPYEQPLYWLNRGIDMEPVAVQAFERAKNKQIERIGFVLGPNKKLGCSPDGLIVGSNDKEAVEIKSPAPWTHMAYLLAQADEEAWQHYRCQVQGQILIGGFDAVHFYSYHPRMPPKYVLTEPDLPFGKILRQALEDFVGELDRETERARELGPFIRLEEIANGVG